MELVLNMAASWLMCLSMHIFSKQLASAISQRLIFTFLVKVENFNLLFQFKSYLRSIHMLVEEFPGLDFLVLAVL